MTRDLRKYAKQTNVRLGAGAFLLLFVVGIGLIYWLYGPAAAIMGATCLLGALIPIAMIFLSLWLLDWIRKRADPD
jgi:hypothetical protein